MQRNKCKQEFTSSTTVSTTTLKYHLKNIHGIERSKKVLYASIKWIIFFNMEYSPHNVAEKTL